MKKFLQTINLFKRPKNTDRRQPQQSPPTDIRESMVNIGAKLPSIFYLGIQQALTEISGKAPKSLPALIEFSAGHRQMMTLMFVLIGIMMTSLAISLSWLGIPLYLIAFLMISASMRTMQVSFTHYATHGTLHRNSKFNDLLGEAYSVFALTTPMWMYKLSHIGGHHGRLNSVADPDASFFDNWGYKPGKFIEWYWMRTFCLLLSPLYYAKVLISRMRANFLPYSVDSVLTTTLPSKRVIRQRQLAAIGFHLTLPAIALASGFGTLYLLAYLLPLIVGFAILSLFQNLSEHQPKLVRGQNPNLKAETKYTAGRFFGKAYTPEAPLTWWTYMLFVAMPSKYLVVGNTELCSHDVHHAAESKFFLASDKQWAMAPYVRRNAVSEGAVFKENWGFKATIEHSFHSLTQPK
ncbi:hypothetical protein CTT31_04120 [Pseudoalteromonas maricaloris]|uniref:fatty acid desaturase n=1 Tax=Pseudoalteromonas maricaloris TaxID=184924 RepID=UPI0021AE0242|nr:fatty acid desaturase [Pseudoalteromonas flavipulchra]USE68348.1 hypothetical protein CTT31_04120 [Pseudoalteromonas flavipulchra]